MQNAKIIQCKTIDFIIQTHIGKCRALKYFPWPKNSILWSLFMSTYYVSKYNVLKAISAQKE